MGEKGHIAVRQGPERDVAFRGKGEQANIPFGGKILLVIRHFFNYFRFQDHVYIGPAHAKGADGRNSGFATRRPGLGFGRYSEGKLIPGDMGIGCLEVKVGRNLTMLQGQDDLAQARDACRGFQMTEIGFDRADGERFRSISAIGLPERQQTAPH